MSVLETERLTLREVTLGDAAFVLELLNEPSYIRFVADRGVRTADDAARYITEKFLPSYAQHGFGFYLVELTAERTPIGICGLAKRETLDDVDIGYSLLERFWGNGYALEAARGVMDYARRVLGLKRVVAFTAVDNESSAKLLGKLGLRYDKMIDLPGYEGGSRLFS
jgi:RimJ/RimL family protein N-acetyltransferase